MRRRREKEKKMKAKGKAKFLYFFRFGRKATFGVVFFFLPAKKKKKVTCPAEGGLATFFNTTKDNDEPQLARRETLDDNSLLGLLVASWNLVSARQL